jgi:ketosteroid isomerase-like protein
MKTLVSLLAAAMLLTAATGSKAQDDVLAAMDVFKNAMISRDGKALDRVLSSDLAYVHSGGEFQDKAAVIDSIVNSKTTIERLEFSDTTVRLYGDVALVRGKCDLWHSPTNIVHMNILHVWVKHPQGWQMVSRQATRILTK